MRSILLPIVCVCSTFLNPSFGQENHPVAQEEVKTIINKIADSLAFYYVDYEAGIALGKRLLENEEMGLYKSITHPDSLAKKLTQDLRGYNGDLHLFVEYHQEKEQANAGENPRSNDYRGASTNYGFQEIKFLEDKLAYLRIDHFSSWDYARGARQKVTEVMSLFKNSEALIIDVRDNRGGVPYIASFLASYFFNDTPVHLADFYTRFNNFRYGIYTEPFVPGVKLPSIPLFILVNNKSASAAEELAFWLQNHKRAVVIGQATAGAGYGALNHQLNERFSISISSEEEINPLTKKGFQGTGVIPDHLSSSDNALSLAIKLAKERIRIRTTADTLDLASFYAYLERENEAINESQLYEQVITLSQLSLLSHDDIYNLGNKHLQEPKKSVPILRAFTALYSFYPHPFELYAKALTEAGDYAGALENFDKAIQIAKLKNKPGLMQFISSKNKFLEENKNLGKE